MKLGAYETGNIYNADCVQAMREMPAACVDMILTDPPYLVQYKTNMRADKNHKFCSEILNDNNPELIRDYFVECYRILKDNTPLYSFCDIDKIGYFRECIEAAGFVIRCNIVWSKGGGGMGDLERTFAPDYEMLILANKGDAKIFGKRHGSVWEIPKVSSDKLVHQNQKPTPLLIRAITAGSKEGDIVFDGFMGSGSTAVAARKSKRQYIGFELDPEYFTICKNRIDNEFSQLSLLWD